MRAHQASFSISELRVKDRSSLAVLIDPEKAEGVKFSRLLELLSWNTVDLILVGGSTYDRGDIQSIILQIKSRTTTPVFLFPGSVLQLDKTADGLLLPSLISGRNAEYLIGKHVESASLIKKLDIPVTSCGYILTGDHDRSSVSYVTQTKPLPQHYNQLIVNTAIAGQFLGMQSVYLEAGSGAPKSIACNIIEEVKSNISVPLFVGGGFDSVDKCENAMNAGADCIVVGNALEEDPELLIDLSILFRRKNEIHA